MGECWLGGGGGLGVGQLIGVPVLCAGADAAAAGPPAAVLGAHVVGLLHTKRRVYLSTLHSPSSLCRMWFCSKLLAEGCTSKTLYTGEGSRQNHDII